MRRAVLMMRQAISPRLAIRIFRNKPSPERWFCLNSGPTIGGCEASVNRCTPTEMANLPRAAALVLFRIHLENGLSVSAGVGLTGLLAGWALGFDAAIAAATGAVCVSISDQPDPLRLKPWILGWALLIAVAFTALTAFTQFWLQPYGIVALVLFTGLSTGLISAYGERALILSMTGVLTFVYAMGRHFPSSGDAISYLELFTAGALFYALYAGIFALILDDRARRLLLAEAMRGFATYLR